MLVVMPLGYGAPGVVAAGPGPSRPPALHQRNLDGCREALLNEVVPIGLNALDRFAWIGAFSFGRLADDLAATFPTLASSANGQLRLLWIACGTKPAIERPTGGQR